jgi:peptide/nickel transport system permease protein
VAYFLFKRLVLAALTIVGVSIIVFFCSRLSGDVTLLIMPSDATVQEIAEVRAKLGLDRPIWTQYVRFVRTAAVGDFGESIKYQVPAFNLVKARIPATVQLASASFLMCVVFGISLGIVAALKHGSYVDWFVRTISIIGQSMPHFWIGLMLILLFAVKLQWLPASGRRGLSYLLMPSVTLALFGIAAIMRVTRSAVLEQLDTDYVRFLRAKGVPEIIVIWKHLLRNALVPVVAMSGVLLATLIGGTFIIEAVFNWPGMGSLVFDSVTGRDYPVIQAAVTFTSVCLVLLNLLVDLIVGVVDPRIRYVE